MNNHLYTIVLDFKGGTHIKQVSHATPHDGLGAWAEELSGTDEEAMGLDRKELVRVLRESSLVPVDNCSRVWCASVIVGDELALINIIQTVDKQLIVDFRDSHRRCGSFERQSQILRLCCASLRKTLRFGRVRFLVSPVPKCEGPGAPSCCAWRRKGKCKDNRRSFDSAALRSGRQP